MKSIHQLQLNYSYLFIGPYNFAADLLGGPVPEPPKAIPTYRRLNRLHAIKERERIILAAIKDRGLISCNQLVELLGCARSTVFRITKPMVAAGIIKGTPQGYTLP